MAGLKLREIAQRSGENPKQALLDSLTDVINHTHPLRYEVIVVTYIQPEKTPGGIIVPDQTLMEDRFQGKVGLLVRIGPLAFNAEHWGDRAPKLHDWVYFNPSDSMEMHSVDRQGNKTSIRRMDDISIRGIVDDPKLIW